ncbi:hypothetical protein DY000_02039873 [Brassica cretica]|uniref:40S ribosomal protein S30 n=1 Tax=Brassica cretica TaxID=69181 RepID=A0ABQ7BNC3_BRACR|nr:hypothetical protein DY000_02039873 [Brassica cretica]
MDKLVVELFHFRNLSGEEANEEKATKKKEMKQETAVTGGAKRRMGQAFVSPRKKLLAKVAAKQGDKAKNGLSKAKNPVE